MTDVVIGDIIPYTQAIAIGGQTVYGTNWTANAQSDVVVYSRIAGSQADDILDVLTFPMDYSVAFIGSQEEVEVTLSTPSVAGDIVTVIRQTPADRLNLYSSTNFTPTFLNNDFGILTLVDQQAQLVNQLTGLRYNYSSFIVNGIDNILPILQANQLWVKSPSNDGFIGVEFNTISAGSVNLGLMNQLAYYAANGTVVSGLATSSSGVLITNPFGVPMISSTLPSGLDIPDAILNQPDITAPTISDPIISGYIHEPSGIKDINGNIIVNFSSILSAINFLDILNNASGFPPTLRALGSDTNIILSLQGKGTSGIWQYGTSTNDIAPNGVVGEIISSSVLNASAVAIASSNVFQNLTSIILTPGNWSVHANAFFNLSGRTVTSIAAAISDVSNTAPDSSLAYENSVPVNFLQNAGSPVPSQNILVPASTTKTIYLVCASIFSAGTPTVSGNIYARREF